MRKRSSQTGLTELESNVLSVVWRHQPTTAYQVRRAFAQSPVQELALSQGTIYPIVERLKKHGYIDAKSAGDARSTEHLTCTKEGEGAVRSWLIDVPLVVPPDPLRSRIVSLSRLDEAEQLQWLRNARAGALETLAALEEYAGGYTDDLYDLANDNARSILLARIRWLDRVEAKLASD